VLMRLLVLIAVALQIEWLQLDCNL
jgi:hypothetical protein